MAIPLFVGDARRTDNYAEANVEISGDQIAEDVDRAVCDADQFLIVIKQSTEVGSGVDAKQLVVRHRIKIRNWQTDIISTLKNLVAGVTYKTNNLNAVNWQPVIDEVFDVRS
ncbi:MAG: hypothetical protein RMX68_030440 [Aulosira sp. ZfuVER01]|nr:hypothetical protein [Aulosira sp. ZfuVER01]MDZ7996801.1 hypothetical protein [Aulosira sp. DedVER01a]MDZ8049927.1 hypothetical protein [Aulosira sp. ZfuCHP01]